MGFGRFLGTVVCGAAAVAVGVVAAPAVGAIASVAGLGAAAGTLSGAAASSAGLAALGGGSLATGGMGMAGGTAVVAGAAGVAGAATGAGVIKNPVSNLAESFVDNVFRDQVSDLRVGAVVYCDLHAGEHSGIYIGDEEIVHLNGEGDIEIVSPSEFIQRLGGFNTAMSIYVSCDGTDVVGSSTVADRARESVGGYRDYNFILDNCHQFTAGCLTGNFENSSNFLWMLKREASEVLGADAWRVWALDSDELFG